jgi:hypothetical protein
VPESRPVSKLAFDGLFVASFAAELVLQGRLDAALWYDCAGLFPLASVNDAFAHVWNRSSPKALVQLRA